MSDSTMFFSGRFEDSSFTARLLDDSYQWEFVVTDLVSLHSHRFVCDSQQAGLVMALAISGDFSQLDSLFGSVDDSRVTEAAYSLVDELMPREPDGSWIVDGRRLIP